MPVRPIDTATYYFGLLDKTIELPVKAVKNIEYILSIEKQFNLEAKQRAERIKAQLSSLSLSSLSVEARSYKNLFEGIGNELIKPRNYVTKEVIEIKAGTMDFIFFIGSYGTPEEAESHIINKVLETHAQRTAKPKPAGNKRKGVRIDSATINSIRAQFRKQ